MNAIIHPHPLKGSVQIPCSKSFAHRLLIAAALADWPTIVEINALNADISATAKCLRALGAQIETSDTGFTVHPIPRNEFGGTREMFCDESGSTLRFMLPVTAALGTEAIFTGSGRLPERPNAILTDALREHGVHVGNDLLPMPVSGRLCGGSYAIAGNVSSQYITGLLLALPLCNEDSDIMLTTALESSAYIDVTLEVLRAFGIRIEAGGHGWHIPGNQPYVSPGCISAEGDWSSAAFWFTANAIGSSVVCQGLNTDSLQGDRAISEMLKNLGTAIDVSNTPDLVPALAVAAAVYPGITRITGAARLRIKESDRLRTVADMLSALGCRTEELSDSLVIHGGTPLTGGLVNGCNDHRIVMAAAIAGSVAAGPVTITDAQAVNKSYPAFFEHFNALGGIAHVEHDR